MSSSTNDTNRKSPPKVSRTGLPPPPRMSGARGDETPEPHSVTTALPELESAPTSATNLSDLMDAANNYYGFSKNVTSALLESTFGMAAGSSSASSRTAGELFQSSYTTPTTSPQKLPRPPPPPVPTVASHVPPPPPIYHHHPLQQGGGLASQQQHIPPPPPVLSPTVVSSIPPPPPMAKSPGSFLPQQQQQQSKNTTLPAPPFRDYAQFHKPLGLTAARQVKLPVFVLATETAHLLAWKNGLRMADLLQGLLSTTNESTPLAPFRSLNRSLILNWDDLDLYFYESFPKVDDLTASQKLQKAADLQPSDGNLEQELELLEDQIDNLLSEDTDNNDNNINHWDHEARSQKLEQVTKDAFQLTSPLNIPWLLRYRQTADECTNGLEIEQFECPAVILSICTTTEAANPIETLRSLQLLLPIQFRNGLYDPNAVRHEVLVLHDSMDGPKAWDETALRNQLVQVFGPASSILRINSLTPEAAAKLAEEEETDLWGGGGKLGTCLTVSDKARIRKYLVHLITTAVLPALERRVNDLNIIVSERKKGVRNVLKSFWGGRKKEDEDLPPEEPSSVLYRYDSVESQTRLLADTLFLVRDYDSAYSVYRLIKDDFKQDKSWNHYASVHEMIALSLYLSDPFGRAKEVFSSIETALLSYSRAAEEAPSWGEKPGRVAIAPASTRLATRLCLVLIATRNICSGRHLEVADLLASASSHENSLGAAVLLEQSSANYFKASMFRKYAFHMIMSGHMFRSAEHEHHAFRCFASALHIYRYGKWAELHSHVRSALAAQLFSMGRMSIALQLYAKLLGTMDGGRVSVKSQQKFVQNLLEICSQHKKKALAGADRMAAPPSLSGSERDKVRKERQDRIVQVVRYTKSASRVLELPNMDVPRIDDNTIAVVGGEAAHYLQESVACFGDAGVGADKVWNELMIAAIAELKACTSLIGSEDEIIVGKTLAKIEDRDSRRVIALIEKERSKMERSKKSTFLTSSAPVRALKEPIAVEFKVTNPLGIAVELRSLQLVARMKGESGRTCTNEDAISIRVLAESIEKPSWTFQGSDSEFSVADFCRVSGSSNEETGGWKSAEEVEPFFVVTKEIVSLKEGSSKIISASICPLTEGDLEIVGVRCRLFNDVWVYHPFDVRGPLLQDTRSNRANRVRGESFLLKSKVERGMPRLAVDLVQARSSKLDGPVLESQIGQWALRFTNMGTAAASNVIVKTNLPWLNVKRKETSGLEEDQPISCCVGPTGTLMTVPLKGQSVDGEIQPGETIEVPIEIKPTGTGKQDFYMLFRYVLPGGSAESRCRWLKKMFTVPVYPSLAVSASVLPSFSTPNEYILSLEVNNCRNDRPDLLDLELENITLVSRNYKLEPIKGQTPRSQVSLGWQEKMVFHFKVTCKDQDDLSLLLSQCAFADSQGATIVSDPALLDSLCLQRTHDDFEETVKQHHMALARAAAKGHDDAHPRSISSIRRANTAASSSMDDVDFGEHSGHPTSILRLCPKKGSLDSIHAVCSWRDQVGSVVGTHHIRGLSVRPTSTKQTGCPIVLTASHPTKVTNDFSVGPVTVPLQVTLRNTLVDEDVEFEFKVEAPESFDFTGPLIYRSSLKSGAHQTLPMKAILPSAGVYNLQKIKLTVRDGESISYSFPFQWMVTATSY